MTKLLLFIFIFAIMVVSMMLYNQNNHLVDKIISGGQTGVDRAALDYSIEANIPHGGWCPLGRIAEDGIIAEKYHLQETESSEYSVRTYCNVRDSDGTLIIVAGEPMGGTLLTIEFAKQLKKPFHLLNLSEGSNVQGVRDWIIQNKIKVLNIAGPRASQAENIYISSYNILSEILKKR